MNPPLQQQNPFHLNQGFHRKSGAILLEVILALTLFVGAAAVISGALNASVDSVEKLRLNTHAVNLAVTVLSEIQLGVRPLEFTGPEPFEAPFDHWFWELMVSNVEEPTSASTTEDSSNFIHLEIIVRHDTSLVEYRLTEILCVEKSSTSTNTVSESLSL